MEQRASEKQTRLIGVASGKGGTGKTTIATNLAVTLAEIRATAYVDCDVEAPNGHIFLKPVITERRAVNVLVPCFDREKCNGCGVCSSVCRYGAITNAGQEVLIFDKLCHSCGACVLLCEAGALDEEPMPIGWLEAGNRGKLAFIRGILDIGQVRTPDLIRCVKNDTPDSDIAIFDIPPGTSCAVVESLKGLDHVVLVAEPTPFGFSDLKLAVELVRELGIAFSVVINRSDLGDGRIATFCKSEGIEVVMQLGYDRQIASFSSDGQLIVEALPEYKPRFAELARRLGLV